LPADWIAYLTVIGMAVVTVFSRTAGFAIMSQITVTPALEAFLRSLASAVVVAALAPAAWHGDWAIRAAIATGAGVMFITRHSWLAMICGIAAAAGWRFFVPA
jgi:uncharacterized membrane protein